MTTVLVLECPPRRARVEGILRWAVLTCLVACSLPAAAQGPPVHWLHAGAMPPGAIGSLRLHRGGPLSGYFQPVEIRAPDGARISLAQEDGFSQPQESRAVVGMQIGAVYRLKITDIPNLPGEEVFPTIELVDRLYPPPGLALRYPVPVQLTEEELEMATQGMFVTRIVYLEDPSQALPVAEKAGGEQPWVEAAAGEDPLVVADQLGRPMAILRMGGRVPTGPGGDCRFSYGAPQAVVYDEGVGGAPSSVEAP